MVAQRCQILGVLLSMFRVLEGPESGVSNLGHFRALETPGGDLGFQGSILGPKTGRNGTCGAPFCGRPLDNVFDDFGMVRGSILESFSSHFGHKKGACTKY